MLSVNRVIDEKSFIVDKMGGGKFILVGFDTRLLQADRQITIPLPLVVIGKKIAFGENFPFLALFSRSNNRFPNPFASNDGIPLESLLGGRVSFGIPNQLLGHLSHGCGPVAGGIGG